MTEQLVDTTAAMNHVADGAQRLLGDSQLQLSLDLPKGNVATFHGQPTAQEVQAAHPELDPDLARTYAEVDASIAIALARVHARTLAHLAIEHQIAERVSELEADESLSDTGRREQFASFAPTAPVAASWRHGTFRDEASDETVTISTTTLTDAEGNPYASSVETIRDNGVSQWRTFMVHLGAQPVAAWVHESHGREFELAHTNMNDPAVTDELDKLEGYVGNLVPNREAQHIS